MAKRIAELAAGATRLSITMEQIQNLNEKAYKTLEQTSAAKLAANQAELDGMVKNAKSLSGLMEKYEERKKLLAEQAEIAKAAIAAEYEEMKKAGADAVLMEQSKADKIKAIETKLTEDLKQNAKNYEASVKAYNDRLFNSFTEGMEVAADKTTKKTKKLAKEYAIAMAESLGATKDSLKSVGEAAKFLGVTEESLMSVAEAAAKVAEGSKIAGAEATKTAEAATKTAEATKKAIDVDATRKKIDDAINGLEEYRSKVSNALKDVIAKSNDRIKAAGENAEEVKRLEAQKAEAVKFYGGEIIKTNQTITAAEKKEQGLSMVQWRQHADNVNKVLADIKKYSQELTTSITGVYGSLISAKDVEIKALADEISDLAVVKDSEEYEKGKAAEEKLSALRANKKTAEEKYATEASDRNAQAIKDIEAKIKAEEKANESALRLHKETNDREKEAQKETRKLNQEKRKLEKQQKKIELSQNIISGISNVALAVTKALAAGPIIGQILAGITAAAGAVQVGILATQFSKMQDGGLLKGKRHTQGGMRIEGTNIEVEGGEYVVNRESTDKNIGLIRYINSQRRELTPVDVSAFFAKSSQGFEPPFSRAFEAGGQLPTIDNPNAFDNQYIVETIRSIRIEPRVSVTDINRVQDEMIGVDGWVGL